MCVTDTPDISYEILEYDHYTLSWVVSMNTVNSLLIRPPKVKNTPLSSPR